MSFQIGYVSIYIICDNAGKAIDDKYYPTEEEALKAIKNDTDIVIEYSLDLER